MSWLSEALSSCELTEIGEGYFLGRGATSEFIDFEGLTVWKPTSQAIPDEVFCDRYGTHGERLEGWLICPVYSPRGRILGFEGRHPSIKKITDYRLPEAKWNPFWIGMRTGMPLLWEGGDVWVTEGLFDLCPMRLIVPQRDAVLASVTARLSRWHVEFLRRFCRGWVHMVYDRDETGRKGVHGYIDKTTGKKRWGALHSLKRVGLECREVHYSGGSDPGEVWDRGGIEALRSSFLL